MIVLGSVVQREQVIGRRFVITQEEVEEVRSRLLLQRWDTMSVDVAQRLSRLKEFVGASKDGELHRHVVVSAIAALQTFHRGTIVSIVDLNEVYKARAAESITEKFSMKEALAWLGGLSATFGELVAHIAPCNSVTDLLSWLSALLACDAKDAMAKAIDPYDRRSGKENPALVVPDIESLLANLAEAFRLRHIFAHEAAPSVLVTKEQCESLLDAAFRWVAAVEAVLWTTAYQDLPLTQAEMNQHAFREVARARVRLAKAMREALRRARESGSAGWLINNHFAWMKATTEWAHMTYGSLQGTMWPGVGASDLAQAIDARAEQVIGWNTSQNT